jgi:hypothetical protein
MRLRRAAVPLLLLLAAADSLYAQRTPPERQPIGRRELERAQDELAARKGREAARLMLRDARLREAVHDFQKNDFRVAPLHFVYGDFVTATGEPFVAMHFAADLPADVTKATLFGIIDDGAKELWSIEEPVALQRTADGAAYFEQSFWLPGSGNATFGFAVKGEPVAMTSEPLQLRTLDKTTRGLSRLLLSKQVFPLDRMQAADDPFAFGGIKVVPKADRTFRKSDEVWIFFEARNPGVDAAGAPKLTTSITIEGNGKVRKGLAGDAQPMALKGVKGHFGVGTTVDVSKLTPGEYLLRVSVEDAVAQQHYELLEKFSIAD